MTSNGINIYSLLYYLSGFFYPLIVFLYSNKYFLNYKFDRTKNILKTKNIKSLIYPLLITLLILSLLITQYFSYLFIFFNNNFNLIINKHISYQILIIAIVSILLLINKTKLIVKKILLVTYFLFATILWTINFLQYFPDYSNIYFDFTNRFLLDIKNLNLINTLYLFLVEIIYFIWSYISYKNNISNWLVPLPKKQELLPLVNILLFYFGIYSYYFILG